LARFADCGLTIAGFCQQEGVSTASFYLWRRRLRDAPAAAESSGTAAHAAAPRFLPVVLSGGSPMAGSFAPAALELELPNQVRLRMAHDVEARFVGELLVHVAGLGPRGLTGGTGPAEVR
jgi:transposase-like protein